MPKLLYVINIFRTAAVPNVLLDIYPHIKEKYDLSILSLEKIDENDRLVRECRRIGISLESLNAHRLNLPVTLLRLKSYLKEHQPDLIHSHLGRADILCALCKNRETKLITTFHNVRPGYSALSQWGYRLTDRIPDLRTSVSKTVQNSWYEDWNLSSPHEVVYNAVATNRLKCSINRNILRAQYGIGEDDFLLLNIGRLTKQKGQNVLVKTMEVLAQRDKRFKLIICGWGALERQLKEKITAHGLEQHIKLLGYVQDVSGLFTAADIFISTPIFEGQSIAVLEAMACKTPIVCTAEESLIEMLDPGKDALFVEKNDPLETADAVTRLASDPTLRLRIANNAYSKYRALHTPQTTARNYLSVYDRLLSVR